MCILITFNAVFIVCLFCRGFGFVTFTDAASVDKVLAQQHHELDSKTVSSFYPHLFKTLVSHSIFFFFFANWDTA